MEGFLLSNAINIKQSFNGLERLNGAVTVNYFWGGQNLLFSFRTYKKTTVCIADHCMLVIHIVQWFVITRYYACNVK